MLLDGYSYREIVEQLKCSKATISYHANKLGLSKKKPNSIEYDWDKIADEYNSGKSLKECQSIFGFSNGAWDNAVKSGKIKVRVRLIPIEELLVSERPQTSRGNLKQRLLKEGLLQNRCYGENCHLTDVWLGKPITLQLEHKNGNNTDNRLENLCLLCPNCHSQTPTFAGRNCKK